VREEQKSGLFAELALPLFQALFNYACWLAHDRGEAEDLVQETYIKALKAFDSFQQGTNFRAWMFRILRNTFLTSRTGLKNMVSIDAEESGQDCLPADTATPESIVLARANWELAQQAIEQMPVGFREVLLLCDLEEMSYQEIADTLALPMGTVMSRVSRARKALRAALQKKLGELH
jgi:RNA polymerase sigma-70 factor (ECF subfamily)